MADIPAVTERVNAARAACSQAMLEELPNGERRNPCFCPLGRALRKGFNDDSVFLAVGTKHLRIASLDGRASELARRIQQAWRVDESKLTREGEEFLTIPLPAELTQFIVEFDAGLLPNFEGMVEENEKWRFNDIARRLWNLTIDRLRRVRRLAGKRRS